MFFILTLFYLCQSIVLCHTQYYYKSYDKETNLTKLTYSFLVDRENTNKRRLLDHFWENYKWLKTTQNLVVSVGDCHTQSDINWPTMLADVVYHWNHVPENQDGSGDVYTQTNLTFVKTACEGAMIKSFNDNYGDTGWYGESNIYYNDDDNYILRATSQVNLYYSLNSRKWQHILCHEIGHGVGLGHQSESGDDLNTCMDYDYFHSNRYPNKHDFDLLNFMYGDETDYHSPDNKNKRKTLEIVLFFVVCLLFFFVMILCIQIIRYLYLFCSNTPNTPNPSNISRV